MNFDKMTKQELIEYIKKIDNATNYKYGLNWDKEKQEEITKKIEHFIPLVKEISDKEIKKISNPNNILI